MTAVSDKKFNRTVALAVCLVGLVGYANTFQNEFVWDDVSSVLLHKHVQNPAKLFQLFREDQHPFGRGQGNFYRPLLATSFMGDFLLAHGEPATGGSENGNDDSAKTGPARPAKVSPFVFHLGNTAWHVLAALFLLAVLARTGAPRFVLAAVPLLYVVHPLHTEAVSYISGRGDPMAAALAFAGLWFALGVNRGRWPLRVIASGLCFAAALLCKESATVFPALLLLLVLATPNANQDGEAVPARRWAPFGLSLLILAVYGVLRMTVLQFASQTNVSSPFGQRLVETGQALARYIGLVFVPVGLHMERTLADTPPWVAVIGFGILIALIVGGVLAWRSGKRRLAAGLFWFLLTWLPISGLFPLNAPMAEHWMYVPLAGFLWALSELLAPLWDRAGTRPAVAVLVYATFAAWLTLTILRNPAWHDNERIFLDTIAKNPSTTRVQFNLAVTYEDLLGNPAGARRHYEAVTKIYEARRKAAEGAIQYFDEELESRMSLGRLYLEDGQYQKAAQNYSVVMGVQADDAHRPMIGLAYLGMGKCFQAVGKLDKAGECYKKAIATRPDLKPEVESLVGGSLG